MEDDAQCSIGAHVEREARVSRIVVRGLALPLTGILPVETVGEHFDAQIAEESQSAAQVVFKDQSAPEAETVVGFRAVLSTQECFTIVKAIFHAPRPGIAQTAVQFGIERAEAIPQAFQVDDQIRKSFDPLVGVGTETFVRFLVVERAGFLSVTDGEADTECGIEIVTERNVSLGLDQVDEPAFISVGESVFTCGNMDTALDSDVEAVGEVIGLSISILSGQNGPTHREGEQ